MQDVDLDRIIETLKQIVKVLKNEPAEALGELRKISSQIDSQIPYRDGHSKRVSEYSREVGKELGFKDNDMVVLEAASLLHDFGKIGVEDDILSKPASLVDSERAEVEKHVLRGYYMLSGFVELEEALTGLRAHHEHYDGLGYPQGLTNGRIPLIGRIIAVTDAYDAMTSDRPYRKARTKEKAVEELKKFAGTQFDPHIVEVFLKILES